MLSPYYKRLVEIIGRHARYFGEVLYTLDHWDDSKSEMDNIRNTSEAFGYSDLTGETCARHINIPLSVHGYKNINDLRSDI